MIRRVTKFSNRVEVILESGEVKGLSSFEGELLGWDRSSWAVRIGDSAIVFSADGSRLHDLYVPSGWSDLRWDGTNFTYLVNGRYQYVCDARGSVLAGPVEVG